jgi:acetyltransferase-like isoleucine patch superfamily enzyme
VIEYGINCFGENLTFYEPIILGFPSRERMGQEQYPGITIGSFGILRSGTTIYCDVSIGDHFQSGHNTLIRERTRIGNNTAIGSATIIEGNCIIGNNVCIQSMAFIPTHTEIGNEVFIGPHAILTNDRYPPTGKPEIKGPVIEDKVTVGGNATILPGVRIGRGSAVAAGAVVTRDIPAGVLAIGSPARIRALPQAMRRIL